MIFKLPWLAFLYEFLKTLNYSGYNVFGSFRIGLQYESSKSSRSYLINCYLFILLVLNDHLFGKKVVIRFTVSVFVNV